MARAPRKIDAVLEGGGTYAGKSYFFMGPVYVRFDWSQGSGGRVEANYPAPIALWKVPATLAGGIDDAIAGQGPYADYAYFFKGDRYYRYSWSADDAAPSPPPSPLPPLSAWHVPSPLDTGVDASLNGGGKYTGRAWFFRGAQYAGYEWSTDTIVSGPTPAALSSWGLPFASVDAAVRGADRWTDHGYFFKNEQYCSYRWADDAVGAARPIVANWEGVLEMLGAGVATYEARKWVAAARTALASSAAATMSPGLINTALSAHFKGNTFLATIRKNFDDLAVRLDEMPKRYRFRDPSEATADGFPDSPAYGTLNANINFTRHFSLFGPMCQAAMVIHELCHTFLAGSFTTATHIPEWYLTIDPARTPAEFATTYTAQSAADAVQNPSAYAAFAQHIYFTDDRRYGAGRPDD